MATQGFFSGSESAEKRRFAGQKENNANLGTRVEPVKVANLYNNQTPSLDYAPDEVGGYIKKAEERPTYKSTYEKQQEQAKQIEKDFNLDPRGVTYTPRDESKYEGSVIKSSLGLPDKTLTTKEKILGNKPIGYREGDGLTINPIKFDKGTAYGIGLNLDYKNKLGLSKDPIFGGSMYSDDPVTQAYVKAMQQSTADSLATEERLRKEPEKNLSEKYESRINLEEQIRKEMGFPSYMEEHKKRIADINTSKDDFGRPLGTMPSMGISEAGRYQAEQNRLQKAKEESKVQEQRNVFQKIGDTVGDVFNKLTGTEAAGAGTLQAQGINTSATTNIAQMGNVDSVTQAARDAVAKANLRKSGLDKTVGGQSSQANYGSGRTGGFGTGTHGKGMPSNPGSQRQTGVGVSAGNLSRHKSGGISKSTSRGQGGGTASRSRGGVSRGGSKASSSGSRGQGGGTASRSKGGSFGGSRKSTNTSQSRRRCDIRTKIDIAELTNLDLIKDDLANLAYFVKEIK